MHLYNFSHHYDKDTKYEKDFLRNQKDVGIFLSNAENLVTKLHLLNTWMVTRIDTHNRLHPLKSVGLPQLLIHWKYASILNQWAHSLVCKPIESTSQLK